MYVFINQHPRTPSQDYCVAVHNTGSYRSKLTSKSCKDSLINKINFSKLSAALIKNLVSGSVKIKQRISTLYHGFLESVSVLFGFLGNFDKAGNVYYIENNNKNCKGLSNFFLQLCTHHCANNRSYKFLCKECTFPHNHAFCPIKYLQSFPRDKHII